MKKIINVLFGTMLFSFLSLFILSSNALATELYDPELQSQYQQMLNSGIIDSSVSYETWANEYIAGLDMVEQARAEMEVQPASSGEKQVVLPAYTQMKAGDIFVTSDSLALGISGHAAIAISSTAILNMPGSMPWNYSTSQILSYAQWKGKYDGAGTKTWIYRHSNSVTAQKAADWARRNYWNSGGGGAQDLTPSYMITNNLYSNNPSYCSKLVWQAYYYTTPSTVRVPGSKIVYPYSLKTDVLGSLWNTKPTLISTIYNYQ